MGTKRISVTDSAKLIRQSLKEAFPGTKFSVRSDKGGSLTSAVRVSWTDGPTYKQVDAVINIFHSSNFTFDIEGNRVRFFSDIILLNREFSDEMIEAAIEATLNKWRFEGIETPTVEDYRSGRCMSIRPFQNFSSESLQVLIWRELCQFYTCEAQPSPTASSFKNAGDDGYSHAMNTRRIEASACA